MQFDKPYSETTAQLIDEEVRAIVNLAYVKTKELLNEKKDIVEKVLFPLLSLSYSPLPHRSTHTRVENGRREFNIRIQCMKRDEAVVRFFLSF